MRAQLLELQSKRDGLRAKLQAFSRAGDLGDDFMDASSELRSLDKQFSKGCMAAGLSLSKAGRLL